MGHLPLSTLKAESTESTTHGSAATRKILIAGGGFNTVFIRYMAQLTGKARPRLCYLPTASADSQTGIIGWYQNCAPLNVEPLVQESFIAALDRLDSFDVRRPFGPWFFRIVVNRGRNAIAARRVRETDALDDEVLSGGASPDRLAEQRELGERIGLALDELSDRQRLVVQLHEIEGFTTAEVAGMLEIAEPTVRWTLHAARKRLRAELAGWKEQRDD